jgi:hypothetical protein
LSSAPSRETLQENAETGHYLYVATPGIRNYLGYGGHGLVVFDIENDHKFVKRIPTQGFKEDGTRAIILVISAVCYRGLTQPIVRTS